MDGRAAGGIVYRDQVRDWVGGIASAVLLVGICGVSVAGEAVLEVTGETGTARSYTLDELGAMPTVTMKAANDHQGEATYTGVEIHELLKANDVPMGDKLRGKHLAEYAVVSARDGYRVVFSLGEVDPAFASNRKIFVAWLKDGKPLPDAEGVLRVIIPAEKHPTRWIRQVSSIRVQAAAEPAKP